MSYPHLFQPGLIGSLEVRNRVVLPSMTTRLADRDGQVTPDLITYYKERARGGCGLVVVEMASPQPRGRHRRNELGIASDGHIKGLQELTAAIHAHGAGAGIQLGHGGARALPAQLGGAPLAATPGPVRILEGTAFVNFPEVFDEEALETLIVDHVRAAQRAEESGFDLVELHGAHGYLLTQLSHDDENTVLPDAAARYRYLAELTHRVVESVDVPVTYRVNGLDHYSNGHSLNDTLELISHLVPSGVSAISVTGGHYLSDDPEIMIPPMPYPDGVFLAEARAVKSFAAVPVIAVGRLNVPEVAERALASGDVDFVAIGRGQIADPHWSRKVQHGDQVRECLACNYCVREMRSGGRLACAVNPVIETVDRLPITVKAQRRLVYGAGPAGLTYALESARAGHEVCVVAREKRWRATWAPTFNGYPPDRVRMSRYFDGLWNECLEQRVSIVAEADLAPEWLTDADVIVDARGAQYARWVSPLIGLAERALPKVPGFAARAIGRRLHHTFLYGIRRPQVPDVLPSANPRTVRVGDAAQPGELASAVRNAYVEAWKEHNAA